VNKTKQPLRLYRGPVPQGNIAVVVSRFHPSITDRLLAGAEECLRKHRVPKSRWQVFSCPGAFELPQVAGRLAEQKKWDCIICLGAVIRGETPHFEYVSSGAARGIQDVALRYSLPVVFGVLTTDTERQAQARAGGDHGNKGWDAVLTALEMCALFRSLKRRR